MISSAEQEGRKQATCPLLGHTCGGGVANCPAPFFLCTEGHVTNMAFHMHEGANHRVHIFTRDETGSVYLPTQLERTLQLYW